MREEIIGRARLILGDCRDVLPTLPKVDAVVTDPPYGIGYDYDGFIDDPLQHETFCRDWFPLLDASSIAISPGNQNVAMWGRIAPWRHQLAWRKPNSIGRSSIGFCKWEPVLLWGEVGRQRADIFTAPILVDPMAKEHPCPKPVKWAVEVIGYLPETAQTILDPFMGSGTTGVAAVQMGRDFIGIEREERYFEIACRRIEEAQRQGDLFIESAA